MSAFNSEIEGLQPSKSMVFMAKAKALQAKDPEVISLAGGEPDFDTPKPIVDEAVRWLKSGYTHYTICPGLPELRAKIAAKLKRENAIDASEDGIIVTPGGKFAIYLAIRSLVNEGDEVVYLEPGWVSYPSIVEASKGRPVPVRLSGEDRFRITRERIERAITPRTKLLIVNYPNNPTGRCLSRAEADEIEALMLAHPGLLLLSDEVYERILFPGSENVSPASYNSIADRVITVNGFSKSVAMTGWRCGYLATTPEMRKVMYKLYQHSVTCVAGFIQKAAAKALDCTDEIESMRVRYERRRAFFIEGLNSIPGVSVDSPEGAFYAWVRFDIPGKGSEAVCDYILSEAKVVGVPGVAYGTDEPFVRFSFASSDEALKAAVENIRRAMSKVIR